MTGAGGTARRDEWGVGASPKRDDQCSTHLSRKPLMQMRKLQKENSFQGKIRRKWSFLHQFIVARAHYDAILRLEPILQRCFEHEWVAGARVRLRFLSGKEDRERRIPWPRNKYLLQLRLLPWREQGCPADWSAPITVAVSKKTQEGKPKTVRYMSFYIKDDVIHIVQLQGVPLVEMPKGLRDWAKRLVKACMEFARQENFRAVKVAAADSLYSYHQPYTPSHFTLEERTRAQKKIRANMERHHDQTARSLGFTPEIHWYRWQNPDFAPLLGTRDS